MKKTIAVLLMGFIMSCGSSDKQQQLDDLKKQRAEIDEQIKNLESELKVTEGSAPSKKYKMVAVKNLTPETFFHYIEVQGKIEGDENVSVSPKSGGAISKIYVKEGQEVKEGQILAELDNQIIVQSIEEVKSSLEFANTMYLKQKNLWDQKIGTEIQYLSAKNNKESLEKKMATLNEQLELTKLKSPINGTVDGIDIKIGQTVMPGMPSIRVVNLSKLKAKAEVSESYSLNVKTGDEVLIVLPDIKMEVKSKINYASKVINSTTRTFMVEAPLENNPNYRPNMIAVLKIIDYKRDSSIIIPVNAIQQVDGKSFVFVAVKEGENLISRKRIVSVGRIYNGNAEIIDGLEKNEILVETGIENLNDGDLIKY